MPCFTHSIISASRMPGCSRGLTMQSTIVKIGRARSAAPGPSTADAIATWSRIDCAPFPCE
jgi:hypothetical protein